MNPVLFALDPYAAGWALVLEFIFTLAMALRCYPLQPGGLLALEAVAIGMTSAQTVHEETIGAIEVVLLLDLHGRRHLLSEGPAAVHFHETR